MPTITAKNVSIKFGSLEVVKQVSFEVEPGTISIILGPNGSGKTTLLRAIAGFEKFTGEIIKNGGVGYVPQRFEFDRTLPITVKEFLQLSLPKCFGDECVHGDFYSEIGVTELLNKHLGTLSGGQLQRTLIARALIGNPKILLLDEPASGIDAKGQQCIYEVIEKVAKHGKAKTAVVMISHEFDVVHEFADQVLCLNQKLFCKGLPENVLNEKTIEQLYGSHKAIYHHDHA